MPPSIDIAAVLSRQLDLAGPIERAVTNLKKVGEANMTLRRVKGRLEALRQNWQSFKEHHREIVDFRTTGADKTTRQFIDAHDYFTAAVYDTVEENFLDAQEFMESRLDDIHAADPTTGAAMAERSMVQEGTQFQAPHLKPIELPKFNGEPRDWISFRDLFQSLVGQNPTLTNVSKLHYLKASVTDVAARRIETIRLTNDNFATTWDYLVSVYDDTRLLVNCAMRDFMETRPVTKASGIDLDRFNGEVSRSITALESLGYSSHHCDAYIVYIVVSKLDPDAIRDWEEHLGSSKALPTWVKLLKFLENRARSLRAYEMAKPLGTKPSTTSQKSARSNHAAVSLAKKSSSSKGTPKPKNSKASPRACALCAETHYISSCPTFRSKSVAERQAVVREKELCFNCLGPHKLKDCTSQGRCQQCNGRHHTLTHSSTSGAHSNTTTPSSNTAQTEEIASVAGTSAVVNHVISRTISRREVLLTTAAIRVQAQRGAPVHARALIDTGSELSFVSEALAQLLKLPRTRVDVPLVGIGGRSSGSTRGAVSFTIRPHFASQYRCLVDAVTLPQLTADLASRHILINDWPHLQGLQLADPDYASSGRIDIILGADVYGQLLKSGLKRGPINAPVAQSTELGWVLSGPCTPPQTSSQLLHVNHTTVPAQGLHCAVSREANDIELHELIHRFWSQEEATSASSSPLSPDEEECEAHFSSTHSRDSSGRYTVRLPFNSPPSNLGDSRVCAARMLTRLQQRFASDSALQSLYCEFLEQYEVLGHMKLCSGPDSVSSEAYYLPHHGVLKESSTTTKLRVVFNGSARSTSGRSINDLLHVGAKLQTNLFDVVLRWRRPQFVFSADVEKMFRQIRVHEEDWRYQRILWSPTSSQRVNTYDLTTVTYGLGPAPFLAIRVMQQLVQDEGHRFPLGADILSRGTYVDDTFGGADTLADAQQAVRQLDGLCKAGGFTLQKWSSNYEVVLDDIPQERRATSSTILLEEDSLLKALGIAWRPATDSFEFSAVVAKQQPPFTKRKVLSRIAQLFDPLGWLSPVTIRAKIFMQHLWLAQLGWDDELPAPLLLRWTEFVETMKSFPKISIPRWLGTSASALAVEIHGFADASEHAMAAVVYLRVLRDVDDAHVTLLCAKTKVAPLKRLTIPRLELTAAALLARQVAGLRTTLDLENSPVHLWTDSTVALTWIRGPASRWKDYVRNRVSAIHEAVPSARWHHVPGVDNPADCASRGLTPLQLQTHPLWWSGPAWMSRHSISWPDATPAPSADTNLEERNQIIAAAVAAQPSSWALLERYSSWTRLLRVTATCRRVFSRRSPVIYPLTPFEIAAEAQFWVRMVQRDHFDTEIQRLSDGRPLPSSSPLIRLTPFLDADSGILRLGGRLRNSPLDPDAKHPPILPRDSYISTLLIADSHDKSLHGGTQATLSYLRRTFWILGGRTPIRSYILKCVRCARQRGQAAQQLMGQLPAVRATPSRAFLHSGVDYAGPLTLKAWSGRTTKTYKGYIVLFVCFSTSALHLEAVTDYSAAGFLAAFRRFTGRRGICATLSSDCGTNLVGADRELREMFAQSSTQLQSLAALIANDGTEWRFNPPSAPHFGGKWEAGVKSVKFHLRRVISDHILTYEELSTLLVQIEAVLNSRPLTPLSDDPDDVNALTPGHFLVGSALTLVPEPSLTAIRLSRLSRWQLVTQMLEHFWTRWSSEYLQRLQGISKWHCANNNVKLGTLVLIIDERFPPSKWPLARVTNLHSGSDGLTRVVTVKTATSSYKRPIAKLCVLPIDSTTPISSTGSEPLESSTPPINNDVYQPRMDH